MAKRGRQPIYGAETREIILAELKKGRGLKAICRDEGMPSAGSVLEWVYDDPVFADRYTRARQIGYALLAEELIEIADDGMNDWMEMKVADGFVPILDKEHVQRSRLRLDTRKWMLAKMLPKIYGERQTDTGGDNRKIPVFNAPQKLTFDAPATDSPLPGLTPDGEDN